ncbi:putative transmembrane protein [Methylocella silvestris BL2]|uniref:Putative transmembrane protein n=1 Tax=Methylocella silvestris (strain DSM 15510 / CIP 108128 / LMG 27833 / NCIMB 13906 / BL2) TaxID=395965 RepID=B8ENL0_METSB|nr:DUF4010 domain-containing protein [Methylocella silvestris]ACK50141.1 putative transmembrane protein [Methylocella silvestris BL2]
MLWFAPPLSSFAVALGLGLLIGLERERSKGVGPSRGPAGIRTFAVASLFGAVAFHIGGLFLLALAAVCVAGLVAVSYRRTSTSDPGLTTEMALAFMPILGALAVADVRLAAAVGVVVAILLAAKIPLHAFVTKVLNEAEVKDLLVFAAATLVIFPQLPDRYMGPFDALNPRSIWLLVILVLTIGGFGYIAKRALGARFGLPLAGLASGFASSTATIGAMAGLAAKEPALLRPAVAAAVLSTIATFIQLAVLLAATSAPTLAALAPALIAGGCAATLYGAVFTARAFMTGETQDREPGPGRAFSIKTALALAATMALMLVAAAALKDWLGEAGLLIGAATAGFVDAHSAAISVASLAASGRLAPHEAALPIMLGMTSNTAAKIIVALSAGARAFNLRIAPGLILAQAAAWGGYLI